jgi:YfiH family protein
MSMNKPPGEDKPPKGDKHPKGHKPPGKDTSAYLEPAENILVFPGFSSSCLFHGTFNRHGGVSPSPWNSNNVSFGLGDSSENIYANRKQIKTALGCKRLVSAKQIHGSRVHAVDESPADDLEIHGFDGLITNVPGIGLMIQQADCQAVLLFDPAKKAIGIAHVGWRGTVADIIAETVFAMGQEFSTEPTDIIAAISPSLGPCCAEFVNFRSELPEVLHGYQVRANYFDFWAISRDQLCGVGVRPENIQAAGICTCCNQDFFSYRRDRDTGRFASVIGMKKTED